MSFTLDPLVRSFTADLALFSLFKISSIGMPAEIPVIGSEISDLATVINSARFNVSIETMAAKAAKDVRNSAIVGFGRNVPVHLSWTCEFEHVVDSTMIDAVMLDLMLNSPPTASGDTNTSEKYRGFVFLSANRGGGGGGGHQINYQGYGFFSRVRWHGEEGASNVQAVITGFGPLIMSEV